MRTTFIYILIDPRTGAYRYVGKADNPKRRLQRHLQPNQLRNRTHKAAWLQGLLSAGYCPVMSILEEVPTSAWAEAEKRWIRYFLDCGDALTNGTAGGDGGSFFGESNPMYGRTGAQHPGFRKKRPQEVIDRIAATKRKGMAPYKISPEGRKAMSDRSKTLVGVKNPFHGKRHSKATKAAWSEKRTKYLITAYGRTQNASAWGREYGLSKDTVLARIHRGWAPERAVSEKPRALRDKKKMQDVVLNLIRGGE